MSHAPKSPASIAHDTTSDRHNSFDMAPVPTTFNLMDHDTQVYYFKYFRQFWASGPAAAVAVVAGVSVASEASLIMLTSPVSIRKCEDSNAIVG